MRLVELLNKANKGYFDGYLTEYYDEKTGKLKSGSGDALAEFIVKALTDTFEESASDAAQIREAMHVMYNAQGELTSVIAALLRLGCKHQ